MNNNNNNKWITAILILILASRMVQRPDASVLPSQSAESSWGASKKCDGKSQQERTRQNCVSGLG